MNKKERLISKKYLNSIIVGEVLVGNINVPVLSRKMDRKSKMGSLMVRCGINRYKYEIPAGLYLIGQLECASEVLVTCNYKLTIDILRTTIKSKGIFLLVLDTYGINVWCAAGKNTFSSKELIYQLMKYDLKKNLKIRKVILPQLGATSMEPHMVRKLSGISIIYGPVRAEDIDEFLESSYKCSEDMRTVKFPLIERLKLAPLELIQSLKFYLISVFAFLLYSLMFMGDTNTIFNVAYHSSVILFLSAIGTLAFPLLISILPFKSFSLNNLLLSTPFLLAITFYEQINSINPDLFVTSSILIVRIMYVLFIGFRFTGSTTFTSFSGAKKEGQVIVKLSKFTLVSTLILLLLSKVVN